MSTDADQLSAEILVNAVEDCLRRNFGPLLKRVETLEGFDVIGSVKAAAEEVCKAAIASLPPAPKGDTGDRGEKGDPGDRGESGQQGEKGADGAQGQQGEPGRDGKDGETGARGETGQDGQRGEQGIEGKSGAQGERGTDGLAGDRGERGEKGEIGARGEDGRDGLQGPRGKDAAEIAIASAIVPERVYAAGTWARYAGGLVRAARDTDPIEGRDSIHAAGWDVIVDGVAGLVISAEDDGRTLVVEAKMTSGRAELARVKSPVPLDAGVWKEGDAYEKGDGVTYGGSWWIAREETSERPGTSKAWRLAVKAGRDGKDVNQSAPAPREPMRLR